MQRSFARRFLIAVVVTLCVAAVLAIWVVLTGTADDAALRGLGSALVALLCVVSGLAGAPVLEREDARRAVGLVTILLSGLDCALVIAVIWSGTASEPLVRGLAACSSLLLAFVHASLMLGRVRGGDGRALRSLTAAAVAFSMLGAAVLAGAFALLTGSPGSGLWRALGVIAVLGTLFTLLALIARRFEGRPASRPGAADDLEPPSPSPSPSPSSTPPPGAKPTGRSLMVGLPGASR